MSRLTRIEILLPELRAYARSICNLPDDVEDLVQDAVERALRSDNRPDELPHLRPWMFRVIRNLHFDELRKRRVRMEYSRREKRVSGELGVDQPRDVLTRLAFERMAPDKREILFLVDIVGLKYAETAAVLDIPEGTVMSRVSRARQALRAAIGGNDAPEMAAKTGRAAAGQ